MSQREGSLTAGQPRLCLAPLAGITDWPFRLLCREHGADLTVTEMISAQGYLCAPKSSAAYRFLLDIHPDEGPVVVQLFGREAEHIGEAARRLSDSGRFAGIDINMGCPAPKVCSGGSGSALMKTPQLAASIVCAARQATRLPLSVKMRIGWDEDSVNAVSFAQILEAQGADSLTVHGRTRSQQYAGKADWQTIALIKQAVSIPVYANGDVFTAQDAQDVLAVTHCDGIAIGRGALGNPWLFAQIKRQMKGLAPDQPEPREVLATALRHADMMAQWKGEENAVVEMRKHFAWYLKGMHGAAAVRRELNTLDDFQAVKRLLSSYLLGTD